MDKDIKIEGRCAECDAIIPKGIPEGLCPQCLLGLASTVAAQEPGGDTAGSWPVTAADTPRVFGQYEILERIGQGGMGVVYKARQRDLKRVVALKLMLSGPLASAAEVKRFRAEATAAATLQHPNVVAIHEVGELEGRHFFSMDYVDGKSLSDVVRRTPLPAVRAARYVKSIAVAVQYAHERGILHRDLKPHNVLIDLNDQPRITDFGLAKQIEVDSDLTVSGAVLGTPSYMPPEQAAGRRREIGPASDVYSLGAILYDAITGRPPFRAETPIDTLRQVLDAEPAAPRLLNRKVPRDLETICLKCLAKEKHQRYATARDLAQDLDRFLKHEPIRARPFSRVERLWRWARRNPAIACLVGATAVLLLLMTFAAVLFRRDTLDNNVHAARLAAQAIQGELEHLGRAVEQVSARPALLLLLERADTNGLARLLAAAYQDYGTNTSGWLRFENWLLLDSQGYKLARWPDESHLTDRSFRDYYRGPLRRWGLNNSNGIHFSRVYRSYDDGLHKFGVSRLIRKGDGTIAGLMVASVGTRSTEGAGLTTAQHKTILVAACDTNLAPNVPPNSPPLPDFVIMLHPAFRANEAAVPINHPNLQALNTDAMTSLRVNRDAWFRDPVAQSHPQFLGRWLAGFARVVDTPFVVIYETRDWVADAVFFAGISLGLMVVGAIAWQVVSRRQRHKSKTEG
jgi:serine/threonine-protein kinase